MKKNILLAMIFSSLATTWLTATVETDNLTTKSISKSHIVTPAFQNPIHTEDLVTTDTTPLFQIKSSGRYYLASDLVAQRTTSTDGVVLNLNVDNVTLNLNSKSIIPHVSSSHTGATAIQVTAGTANVHIMNGTIQGLDANGTQRFAKGVEVPTTGTVNTNVKLSNLHVTRLRDVSGTSIGFDLNGVNGLLVENCNANDGVFDSAGTAATLQGLNLNTVNNFLINGCESNNNSATAASAASTLKALRVNACTNGIVKNSITSNNTCIVQSTDAATAHGIEVSLSSGIHFENCQASSNTANSGGNTGSSIGFYLTNASLCRLTDCSANNNNDDSGTNGGNPTGFRLASGSDRTTLVRCRAEQNNTTKANSSAYGIRIESDNNTLQDCVANANSGVIASYGIYLSGSTENTLTKCTSNYNQSSTNAAYGVFMTGSCNNNHFKACTANGNQATANSQSVAGFYSTGGSDNIFEDCLASGNDAYPDGAETGTTAAGFRLAGPEVRPQLINCRAVGNRGGTTSSFAYGIYLESATNATIKNCYLAYNNVANGAAFGFADDTATSGTVLINNLAIGQGQCLGGTLDASLQWANNVKPTSTNLNYFFKHAGTGDDPRSAIQEAPLLSFLSISTTVGDWTNISLY